MAEGIIMADKLKAGVIGLGVGARHINSYLIHPDVEVIAIASRSEDPRSAKIAETFPAFKGKVYEDGMEMLAKEKLDIVSVCVPNFLHKDLTIAALESGANVLCEKPMALNAADAQEMVDAAKRTGKKLGINFSYRFRYQSQAMKDLIDSGIAGDIYYGRSVWLRRRGIPGLAKEGHGNWFFDKSKSGGGPLIDLGVHRLDLALWLMGYPEPEWVLASTYNHLGTEIAGAAGKTYGVEDFATAMVKFRNGATLQLDASWAANIKEKDQISTRLLGRKGGVYQYNTDEHYGFETEYYCEVAGKQYDGKLHGTGEVPDPYTSFVNAVRDNTEYLVRPEEGVTVMKLLDAIYLSAQDGVPVKIS